MSWMWNNSYVYQLNSAFYFKLSFPRTTSIDKYTMKVVMFLILVLSIPITV